MFDSIYYRLTCTLFILLLLAAPVSEIHAQNNSYKGKSSKRIFKSLSNKKSVKTIQQEQMVAPDPPSIDPTQEMAPKTYPRKCEGDCKNGIGTGYFSHDTTTIYYKGEWIKGMKEGEGLLHHPSGNPKYKGNFIADLENGEGIRYQDYSGMVTYQGEWKNGLRHGKGTLFYKNGDSYTGNFSVDKKNGEGIYTFSDGSEMKGTWKNNILMGKATLSKNGVELTEPQRPHVEHVQTRCQAPYDCKNGYGVFIYDDGRKYEGQYKDAQFDGYGKFYNARGVLIYEGDWSKHQRHGQGVSFRETDGQMLYEGGFLFNHREGYGTIYHPTVESPMYKGDWVAGRYHGDGTMLDRKGKVIYRGEWRNGAMVKERIAPVPVPMSTNVF